MHALARNKLLEIIIIYKSVCMFPHYFYALCHGIFRARMLEVILYNYDYDSPIFLYQYASWRVMGRISSSFSLQTIMTLCSCLYGGDVK